MNRSERTSGENLDRKKALFWDVFGVWGGLAHLLCAQKVRYHDSLKPRCRIQPRHLLDAALGEVLSP